MKRIFKEKKCFLGCDVLNVFGYLPFWGQDLALCPFCLQKLQVIVRFGPLEALEEEYELVFPLLLFDFASNRANPFALLDAFGLDVVCW